MFRKIFAVALIIGCSFVWAQEMLEEREEDFYGGKSQMEAEFNKIKEKTDKPTSKIGSIKPQIIESSEIKPLSKPEMTDVSTMGFPNDVKIGPSGEQRFCPSMAIDGTVLYCAVLAPPDGSHPYQFIRIYESTDYGANWDSWSGCYSSSSAYNLPSLAVTDDNIVVAFVRTAYGNIGSFWQEKNGSDYGFSTIDAGPGCSHPSLDKYCSTQYNTEAAYLKSGDVMFSHGASGGTNWFTPEVVALGSYDMKFDGAISYGFDGTTPYFFVCYFDGSHTYVNRRDETGTWTQVFQLSGLTRYPSIRGLHTAPSTILMYGDWYHNGQYDLQFTFSYNTGDPGTWEAWYWNDPDSDELWPIIGNPYTGNANWFTIAFWDYDFPPENMVANIRCYYNDIVGNDSRWWSSVNCTPPYLYSNEGKIGLAYRSSDGLGYTAFEDRREGQLSIYFNHGDNPESSIAEFTNSVGTSVCLKQNHPNPVVFKTEIEYTILKKANVELKVYDISGREITTLVSGTQDAGSHRVNWDIRSISEKKMPNGIYFYRLKAGDFTEIKKMIVCR